MQLSSFAVIVLVSMIRSLIHIFAPDGGAGSIAGIDLTVTGAQGIVFAFGLWGSSQFLMSLFKLLVIIRYRSLIPLMYLFVILEIILRIIIGGIKPVEFQHIPPGAIGNWVILPLAALMFTLCFIRRKN